LWWWWWWGENTLIKVEIFEKVFTKKEKKNFLLFFLIYKKIKNGKYGF
jgi:hypothetical protein